VFFTRWFSSATSRPRRRFAKSRSRPRRAKSSAARDRAWPAALASRTPRGTGGGAAPERRGAVGKGFQGVGDAPGVPQGRQQAGQQQAAIDDHGHQQGPAQRRFDFGHRHRHHRGPARPRHGDLGGARPHAFLRDGGEKGLAGGDGRERGGVAGPAHRPLGVYVAGHQQALPVHQNGDPARREALLGHDPVQRIDPKAHGEIVGDAAAEADRHVHGDQRLLGHRGGVKVGDLRLAGGEDPRHHAEVAAWRQGRAEGPHGVQQHPPGFVRERDARPFRLRHGLDLVVEGSEIARGEVGRGGEHLQGHAGELQLTLHRRGKRLRAGRQHAFGGRPARFPRPKGRQHGNQQGRDHDAEHEGDQPRTHRRLRPAEALAPPPGGPDRTAGRRTACGGCVCVVHGWRCV
jgi:hypothetical protein